MYSRQSYNGHLKPSWCKGCSFGIVRNSLNALFYKLQLDPLNTSIISGIGCSSRLPLFSATFGMHTLHGRAIPVAIGAHLSRPDMPVIVTAGDGDLFSIGTGHFVHAARNNFNITVLCFNNRMYSLTRNQSSPTSPTNHKGSLTPFGTQSPPLNVIEFAIACKASFVARTTTFLPVHMSVVIEQALTHKGFSFIEIVAPCKTFDSVFYQEDMSRKVCDINSQLSHKYDHYESAILLASYALDSNKDSTTPLHVGIFYKMQKQGP